MPAVLKLCSTKAHIVHVEGTLGTPVSHVLRHNVASLLRRGERRIVLDLSAVSRIDAAGIGELVRAFNTTAAVNGRLRIVNATAWVRQILERAQLFGVLSGCIEAERRLA